MLNHIAKYTSIAVLLGTLNILSACGQKGPLKHPDTVEQSNPSSFEHTLKYIY